MRTEYEHYRDLAKANVLKAAETTANHHDQQTLLATAQVYATLALAEATQPTPSEQAFDLRDPRVRP